jgi:DNA-binding transcriptional regulator YiaG
MYHYKSCGLDNVWLANGYTINKSASGKGYSIHNLEGLLTAIAKSLVHKKTPLTAKEFRFLRIELDLSQKAIAQLMGNSEQTIANWEKGKIKIPVLADKAIRDIYLESIGEGHIAGLLETLSKLDRQFHETKIRMELKELKNGSWQAKAKTA